MKILTSNLMPPALNWLVAKCQGIEFTDEAQPYAHELMHFNYCTDWALGGWIIEREKIAIFIEDSDGWVATDGFNTQRGDSPLIAAMRCYVANELGDEVDVPDELVNEEIEA